MNRIKSIIKSIFPNWVYEWGSIDQFAFSGALDPISDIQEKYNFEGDLIQIYGSNKGAKVHKWHHYLPLYDRYFSRFRNTEVRFLEIGVSKGGSMQMWRRYFGDRAVIFGIDINPDCKQYDGLSGNIRIGSQTDPFFLDAVVKEMGGVDIVLDDGSHHMRHIPVTLQHLFPKLHNGGIYMIEDLHNAYWRSAGGGYTSKRNFFNIIRYLIDDMHHWYHGKPPKHKKLFNLCSGISIHDSIAVLEKNIVHRPTHSLIG